MVKPSCRPARLSAVLSSYVGVLVVATDVPHCDELDPPQPTEPQGVVVYASETPVVDGAHEAAWNPVAAVAAEQLLAGDSVGLTSSLGMSWRAAWDAQFLYIVATVLDDRMVDGESPDAWNDDSVEVFLDGAPLVGRGDYGRHDYHLLLRPGAAEPGVGPSSARDLGGFRFRAARHLSYGYVVELAVPWQRLGMAPRPGARLGIDVQVNDDDDGGEADRKLATYAETDGAPHDLTLLRTLALGESPTPGAELPWIARGPATDTVVEPDVWNVAHPRAIDQTLEGEATATRASPAHFRAVADARALHVLAEVEDESLHVDSRLPWHDDSIELHVRGAHGTRRALHYVFRFGDSRVRAGVDGRADERGVRFSSWSADGSLHYELELPWRALGMRPRTGDVLGLDVHVNDDDDGGPRDRKAAAFAEVDEAWRDTSLLGSFVLVAGDEARFEALGDVAGGDVASFVQDVSASGEVVVGYSRGEAGDQAVRHAPGEGLVSLGGGPSRAYGVSPHGKLVSGSVAEPSYEAGQAGGLFRPGAPFAPLLGAIFYPGGPQMFEVVVPYVVLDDARARGTCIQYGAYGEALGCRADAPFSVEVPLGSEVFAADAAGNWAGTRYPPSRYTPPFRSAATLNGATLAYPGPVPCIIPHDCSAEARAFSEGAALVVGTSRVPRRDADPFAPHPVLVPAAFLHAQAEGVVRLDDYAGDDGSGAHAIDAAGRVIGGFGTDALGEHAVVWVDRRPALLAELFALAGGMLPDGFVLRDVRALSHDGRTFVGNGENAAGAPEGYRIVLPAAP
jgi:hypothetical protein